MVSLRLVHAIPDAPNVDVYVDKTKLVTNIAFSEVTAYLQLNYCQSRYRITVLITGTTEVVVKDTILISSEYTSVVVCMDGEDAIIKTYVDDRELDRAGVAMIRLIHLVNGAPSVNMVVNNNVFIEDVSHLDAKRRKIGLGLYFYTASVVLNLLDGATIVGPIVITPMNRTIHTLFVMGTAENTKGVFVLDSDSINDVFASNFNLQSYMGDWNLIAEIPQPYIPPGTAHQHATYTLLHDEVKVFNQSFDADGALIASILGKGEVPNPLYPAALRVSFDVVPPFGVPSDEPNYLVHKYDKDLVDGYAYVGSGNRASYYLLSRSKHVLPRVYDYFIYMGSQLGYNTSKIVRYD